MMAEDTMEQLLIYIIPIVVGVSLGLILVIVRDWSDRTGLGFI